MMVLTIEYMAHQAVYFEPENTQDVQAIQRKLLDLGYGWGVNQHTVSYVNRCLSEGITALPNGRMFCGIPLDHTVAHHTLQELENMPVSRKLNASVSADVRQEVAALRREMSSQFDAVMRRQALLESNQKKIMQQMEQVLSLLKPQKVDLHIKKRPGPRS